MNKPIKLGMVGLGRAGRTMHLEELEGKDSLFEIYAVCDLERERCEEFKEKFGSSCGCFLNHSFKGRAKRNQSKRMEESF